MTFAIMLSLCIVAWLLTLIRMRAIHWKDVRKDNGIALNVWLMMVFFSITMIFLIKRFCNYFDAHTLNNLDRLISYSSILIGIFFGAAASVEAVGKPSDRRAIDWLQKTLILIIVNLAVIYTLFISRLPNMNYFVPRSLPEALFMFVAFFYGATMCAFVDKVYLSYLPLENSPVMRTRTILIVVSTFLAFSYFLVKIASVGGYFWPILASQALINLSMILLVFSALIHLSALLSNKLYVPFVLISRNLEGWDTFKDLKYLTYRMRQLCPEVVLPLTDPSFLTFMLNPEYHLYSALITIMDGKTMIDDLLLEGAFQGEPALWEGELLQEAVQVKRILQTINQSGDFWEIVSEYRLASRRLILGPNQNLSWEAAEK